MELLSQSTTRTASRVTRLRVTSLTTRLCSRKSRPIFGLITSGRTPLRRGPRSFSHGFFMEIETPCPPSRLCPRCKLETNSSLYSSWECGSWIGAGTRKFQQSTSCKLQEAINLLEAVQKERGTAGIPEYPAQLMYQDLDMFLERMDNERAKSSS